MASDKGILIVLSGFSGSGKGTVVKHLLAKYPQDFALSVSATTRSPREGEEEGVSYFFRSREQFEQMIAQGELLEYAEYVGNYYGTPLSYVREKLAAGQNVILEIETQGAMKVKAEHPDTLLLFMTPPDAGELIRRLKNRGTGDDATITARMKQAAEETRVMDAYDYIVVNDDVDACAQKILSIIQCEKSSAKRNPELIEKFRLGLQDILKGE